MKITSELLYKKIDQFYHTEYIKNSYILQNLLIIKSKQLYHIYLTQKLKQNIKYTTLLVEQTNWGYQTTIQIKYQNNTQMVPVRFQNEVIPPPILEDLIPIFRNVMIDNILTNYENRSNT